MYTQTDNHYVVHIGGAQFIPPIMNHFNPTTSHSLSPSSEAWSSNTSSPIQSRFSSSSSSSSSSAASENLDEWDAVQAHFAYARRMVDHTALMWQKERLAIEKSKLDGTYTGNVTSRQNGNARPQSDTDKKKSSTTPKTRDNKTKKKAFGTILTSFSTQSR
ncbi:uncharacterized protein MEPE_00354 [Melanopsichium pennsylvanicum]|uniref:Uncharacterized protein n=1 Tax=Melanopsichium pennsylvanicum TaxID=63383 RepID=A0AAJ4XFX3_9BASI|nr:uncharacterized protein MEPE_00354 [Melanopsichium pennsylvanicum]